MLTYLFFFWDGLGGDVPAAFAPDRCEYTIPASRTEYTIPSGRPEYTVTR